MATFVKSYGNYMIYNTSMNQYIVKDKEKCFKSTSLFYIIFYLMIMSGRQMQGARPPKPRDAKSPITEPPPLTRRT